MLQQINRIVPVSIQPQGNASNGTTDNAERGQPGASQLTRKVSKPYRDMLRCHIEMLKKAEWTSTCHRSSKHLLVTGQPVLLVKGVQQGAENLYCPECAKELFLAAHRQLDLMMKQLNE